MHLIIDIASLLLGRVATFLTTRKALVDIATFVSVLLFCIAFEYRKHRLASRYLSRNFRTDLLYSALYLSGAYSLFVGLPLYSFISRVLTSSVPFLHTRVGTSIPVAVQFLFALCISDFTYYVWHRTVHATPFLWAFHSIHHSQQEMTFATSLRVHLGEETVRGLFYFVPFYIFGFPPQVWLPIDIAMNWLLFLEHSDLDWTYGRLGRLIVSPHYHRIHHSVEPQDLNRNFGSFLSIWDRLFGTASNRATRPAAYGVPGNPVPESFFAQIFYPFLSLMRSRAYAAPSPAVVAPNPVAASLE